MILLELLLTGWRIFDSGRYTENCLTACFDDTQDKLKIKRVELKITDKGFFRLRKYYQKGKQEYYSFNIKKFAVIDYLGTEESGMLIISTRDADVIVQTYNDPAGNIDSMSNSLKIPIKNITVQRLDSLEQDLLQIKSTGK